MTIESPWVCEVMEGSVNFGRRGFLRGRIVARRVPIRPPWAIAELDFAAVCTRCAACVDVCKTGIVVHGDGGFPEIDFSRGECTFCRACLDNCQPRALSPMQASPWQIRPEIKDACLASRNVVCRSCGDACEARALRFVPRVGGAALPELVPASCTGCGACVRACPAQAVSMMRVEEAMQ